MDLVLRDGFGGIAQLLDVALTYPLRADAIALAVKDGPDAVANAYQQVKWHTYGPLVAQSRGAQCFTPLVFDMFGGCSTAARVLLSCVAQAYGKRVPEGERHGRLRFAARLHHCVMLAVGNLAHSSLRQE